MYYAKQIDENGDIIALHTMNRPFTQTEAFIPITEAKYYELLAEMQQQEEQEETDEISDSEALAIITGGTV